MIHKYILAAILALMLIKDANSLPSHQQSHWVALFPASFDIKENREAMWTLSVYDSENKIRIGVLEVLVTKGVYGQIEDMSVFFVPSDSKSERFKLKRTLFNDIFHLYVPFLERSNDYDMVKVMFSEMIGQVWLRAGDDFDYKFQFGTLKRGMYLSLNDSSSKNARTIVIEQVNRDSVLIRDAQNPDVYCGEGTESYEPYTTEVILKSNWIKPNGESIFKYFQHAC